VDFSCTIGLDESKTTYKRDEKYFSFPDRLIHSTAFIPFSSTQPSGFLFVDLFAAGDRQAHGMGYDVYAVEYAGFGHAYELPSYLANCRLTDLLLQNITEAWTHVGDEQTIACGFSLGGITLGAIYDDLTPPPAQIIFASTCGSMEALLREKLWLPAEAMDWLMMPFLQTIRWKTKPPQKYHGKILIVHAQDDQLIRIQHAHQLYQTFQSINPVFVELPEGGHVEAFIRYWDMYWKEQFILPPS
jgi:hypothetical protein